LTSRGSHPALTLGEIATTWDVVALWRRNWQLTVFLPTAPLRYHSERTAWDWPDAPVSVHVRAESAFACHDVEVADLDPSPRQS